MRPTQYGPQMILSWTGPSLRCGCALQTFSGIRWVFPDLKRHLQPGERLQNISTQPYVYDPVTFASDEEQRRKNKHSNRAWANNSDITEKTSQVHNLTRHIATQVVIFQSHNSSESQICIFFLYSHFKSSFLCIICIFKSFTEKDNNIMESNTAK